MTLPSKPTGTTKVSGNKYVSSAGQLSHFDQLPDSALLAEAGMVLLFSVSASTIWRRVRAGKLPKPIRMSSRCTRWRVGDVRKALQAAQG